MTTTIDSSHLLVLWSYVRRPVLAGSGTAWRLLSTASRFISTSRCPLVLPVLSLFVMSLSATAAHAQEVGLIAELPGDEKILREQLALHSVRLDSARGDVGIPVNLYYQMLLRELLTDRELRIRLSATEIALIESLAAPWDKRFVSGDREQLLALCDALTTSTRDPEELAAFALRFDEARRAHERELDDYYSSALLQLESPTRVWVHQLLEDLVSSRQVAYAVFDLAGFASAMPEAAGVILKNGCDRFHKTLSAEPLRDARLGDVDRKSL